MFTSLRRSDGPTRPSTSGEGVRLSERVRMQEHPRNPFRSVRKTRASREIVAQIRDMIAGGHLKAGDHLPPERVLAQNLGVGRSTLREAIRVIESLGLLEVCPGEGTFLATPATSQGIDYLPADFLSKWTTRLTAFELRAVVEPGLASLAARRAAPEHVAKMRAVLAAQAATVERGESGMDEDAAFHALIAKATGNVALVQLTETLTQRLQETRDASLQRNGRPARSLSENRGILAAIEARNPALAMRRMQAHIRNLERVLFATGLQPDRVSATEAFPSVTASIEPGGDGHASCFAVRGEQV